MPTITLSLELSAIPKRFAAEWLVSKTWAKIGLGSDPPEYASPGYLVGLDIVIAAGRVSYLAELRV
jgi:hypothetical protein